MKAMNRRGCLTGIMKFFLVIIVLLIMVLAGFGIYNMTLPEASENNLTLDGRNRILLDEATHLRESLGDQIWPGWDTLEIPWVVYNESHVFLMGIDKPAVGWMRVPRTVIEGGHWTPVEGEDYFRQPLPDNGPTPQAFIVQVGDQYAASMTTREWTGIQMVRQIGNQLPDIIEPIFPFGLLLRQFNSDWYVSALLHESFHVLQAVRANESLIEAENVVSLEDKYPWDDPEFRTSWLEERRLLAAAIGEEDLDEMINIADRWLKHRSERRQEISDTLIQYEQKREWLEGLAKYAELMAWKMADESDAYEPLPAIGEISDFNSYKKAESHWKKEISQLKSDMQFDETIFYYSGWAQAVLLDRLNPGWKSEVMKPEVFLEDLFP